MATASYFINQGEATAENHVSTIPVVSLVSDPDYLFGAVNGIYVAGQTYYEKSGGRDSPTSFTIEYNNQSDYLKYANFNAQHETHPDPMGMEWERPAHIDYIGADGTLLFEEDLLCRIFGAFSRYDKQKGIALVSRAGYGSTSMDYAFFDNRPYTSVQDAHAARLGQGRDLHAHARHPDPGPARGRRQHPAHAGVRAGWCSTSTANTGACTTCARR